MQEEHSFPNIETQTGNSAKVINTQVVEYMNSELHEYYNYIHLVHGPIVYVGSLSQQVQIAVVYNDIHVLPFKHFFVCYLNSE